MRVVGEVEILEVIVDYGTRLDEMRKQYKSLGTILCSVGNPKRSHI